MDILSPGTEIRFDIMLKELKKSVSAYSIAGALELELDVYVVDESDGMFGLKANGEELHAYGNRETILSYAAMLRKGYDLGHDHAEADLGNGHKITVRTFSDGESDYPSVEITADDDPEKTILGLEFHNDSMIGELHTYFYNGKEISQTVVQDSEDFFGNVPTPDKKDTDSEADKTVSWWKQVLERLRTEPEFRGQLVNTVEDFLSECGVTSIPSSEKEKEDAGDTDDENTAIIYGSDYGKLADALTSTISNWIAGYIIDTFLTHSRPEF